MKLKQKIKVNISDVQLMYDLLSYKVDNINSLTEQEVLDTINKEWDNNYDITVRDIFVIRDSTLQEEILDLQLLFNNLGYV